MELAHDRVHMKTLAAARRPQTEKIGIISQFILSLFSRDVDSHRHALTVGVVNLQRRFLAVQHTLLVHQAHRRIGKGQETVVFLIERVAVARKRTDEQFQLVVCPLADMDTPTPESVFQVVRTLLQVCTGRHGHHHVEVCIYQLLALTGDDFLHTLDVLDRHLVVRIGNARVAVLLFVEQRQLTLLVGQEDDLVIDHRLGVRDAVHHRHQIDGHFRVVDLDIRVRTYL